MNPFKTNCSEQSWPAPAWPRLYWLLALAGLASLAGLAAHYLVFSSYFDHGEPNVALRAWRVVQGQPAYSSPGAPDFLITLYGPMPYIWNALWLKLTAGSIAFSKLGGISAALIVLAAFAHHVWRNYGPAWLPFGLTLIASGLLMGLPYTLWTRADPVTLMLACLGLVGAAEGRRLGHPLASALALGLAAGLAMNVKAHAFIFLAPIAFGYVFTRWQIAWPLGALAALFACFLPFAFPLFSLSLYVDGLRTAVNGHEVQMHLVLYSLKRMLPLMAPLLLLPMAWRNLALNERLYALFYGACLLAGLYPASVSGSAWYQLVPFLPIWADLSLLLARKAFPSSPRFQSVPLLILAVTALALGWPAERRLHRYISERAWMSDAAQEIRNYLDGHPKERMEMGFGRDVAETYRTTFMKPMLAFAGMPTTLDGWSDMETAYVGVPPSKSRRDYIASCQTKYWLIPAGEPPFTMKSVFLNQDFLEYYREAFLESYALEESGKYFDLWGCRKKS
jgi:hypothetical protein